MIEKVKTWLRMVNLPDIQILSTAARNPDKFFSLFVEKDQGNIEDSIAAFETAYQLLPDGKYILAAQRDRSSTNTKLKFPFTKGESSIKGFHHNPFSFMSPEMIMGMMSRDEANRQIIDAREQGRLEAKREYELDTLQASISELQKELKDAKKSPQSGFANMVGAAAVEYMKKYHPKSADFAARVSGLDSEEEITQVFEEIPQEEVQSRSTSAVQILFNKIGDKTVILLEKLSKSKPEQLSKLSSLSDEQIEKYLNLMMTI